MNKIDKIFKKIYIALYIVLPTFAFAQNITIINPLAPSTGTTLMQIITALLNNVIMPIAAVLVVIYIIYAGFTFVTANGNPKKIEEAKQRLLWALIGAGILLGAAAIAAAVRGTICGLLTTPCPV